MALFAAVVAIHRSLRRLLTARLFCISRVESNYSLIYTSEGGDRGSAWRSVMGVQPSNKKKKERARENAFDYRRPSHLHPQPESHNNEMCELLVCDRGPVCD